MASLLGHRGKSLGAGENLPQSGRDAQVRQRLTLVQEMAARLVQPAAQGFITRHQFDPGRGEPQPLGRNLAQPGPEAFIAGLLLAQADRRKGTKIVLPQHIAIGQLPRSGDQNAQRSLVNQRRQPAPTGGAQPIEQMAGPGLQRRIDQIGKRADFAVLDADPTGVDAAALKDVPVWGTVQGGRVFAAATI